MIQLMSDDKIKKSCENSLKLLNEFESDLNTWRENNNDHPLSTFVFSMIQWSYNPSMITSLKFDEKEVTKWFDQAVSTVITNLIVEKSIKFQVGFLGSIWVDTSLTGAGKTRLTRVCLYEANIDDTTNYKYHIMLDSTFDPKW